MLNLWLAGCLANLTVEVASGMWQSLPWTPFTKFDISCVVVIQLCSSDTDLISVYLFVY
jgi:hypothetical protein